MQRTAVTAKNRLRSCGQISSRVKQRKRERTQEETARQRRQQVLVVLVRSRAAILAWASQNRSSENIAVLTYVLYFLWAGFNGIWTGYQGRDTKLLYFGIQPFKAWRALLNHRIGVLSLFYQHIMESNGYLLSNHLISMIWPREP